MIPKFKKAQHPDLCDRWEIYFDMWDPNRKFDLVMEWCWTTFGRPNIKFVTGVKSVWDSHGRFIYFYDEKCVTMYMLRWA
jgi:hypothetical protein